MLRILFTGGGTGGHIYPIIAVAEELNIFYGKLKLDLRYFGAPGDYKNLLNLNNIRISKIFSAKLRRYFDLRNLLDIPIFFISVLQALWKVFWFMPDVLFSKGGPGSLAIVLVCKFYRIPIIIHESDVVPGLSNRLAGRCAKRIGVSFVSAAEFFLKSQDKIALAGNPIRRSLISGQSDKATAKRNLGFKPEMPLILVMGGSQGAAPINDFFLDIAQELIKNFNFATQVFHITGPKNFQAINQELNLITKDFSQEEKSRYKVVAYLEKDYKDALAAADLIISRAGSGSIFEIAAFGKPSILVPLPEAAYNHQAKNAYEYASAGAAIVIEQNNLTPNIFLNQLKKLFFETDKLRLMSEAAKKFAKPEAAKIIAEEIIKIGSRAQI